MTNFDDEPTKVEMLLSEINNTGKSAYSGVLKPLSIRLPIQTYAKVVAIENFIGVEKTSKNKIINDLLEIAFDQIYPSLSESQNKHLILSLNLFWMVRSQANYDQVRRNSIERLYSTRRTK